MKLKKLLKIYAKAIKIVDGTNYWSDTYDEIFSAKISYKVNKYLNYTDPNGGSEEDVMAFMDAFQAYVISKL